MDIVQVRLFHLVTNYVELTRNKLCKFIKGHISGCLYICSYCSFYRRQLSAHWWGFRDPHSSLSHYEWRAGTTPGSADILSSTRIELSQSALMFLSESDQMLENTDIYITVRAYNGLGRWSESTSNGFRVDSSRPQVIQEPTIDGTVGVVVRNTQVIKILLYQ